MKRSRKNKEVSIQDIADYLKLSASSVSRALNDNNRISNKTKEKVKEAATRLGYFSDGPSLMSPDKTDAIAVVISSLENNIYRELVSGITDFLHEHNYQPLIVDTRNDNGLAHSFFQSYKKYGISGIIQVISDRSTTNESYLNLKKNGLPLVTIFEPEINLGISSVVPDIYQGVYKIVEYLKLHHLSKMVLLLEDENKSEDSQLVAAFESAMEMFEIDENQLSVSFSNAANQNFEKTVSTLLKEIPDALIVKGAYRAIEVKHLCKSNGLKIPEDMLLITFDSEIANSGLTANLSQLKLPALEMGKAAGEILLSQIRQPGLESTTKIIPANFILKGSAIRVL